MHLGRVRGILALLIMLCSLAGCGLVRTSREPVTLVFRTWDPTANVAYQRSFAEFTAAHPDIKVRIEYEPWTTYFSQLRTDMASGAAPDLFWLNNASYRELASEGRLVSVDDILGAGARKTWDSDVVSQFVLGNILWAVPQTVDGGTAIYYNKALLDQAGIKVSDIDIMRWSPVTGEPDSLVAIAQKLTRDEAGFTADNPRFDPTKVAHYGFSASQDLQAIILPFIGSNGGTFMTGRTFTLTEPKTVAAFNYVSRLINTFHVAPPAAQTNEDPNYTKQLFLDGRLALFQSGSYNLAEIYRSATFEWGLVHLPSGPAGPISTANGVAAAGNAASEHAEAVNLAIEWLGSREGQVPLAEDGSLLPAVRSAQYVYFRYWESKHINVSPLFMDRSNKGLIAAPGGAHFNDALRAAKPNLNRVFEGSVDTAKALADAEQAANYVMKSSP
ncbi:extracellular solute-binding protein [Micrococcales bacterium 31B]|nr:extracellular solute-binding protein [Micrococcales bacterium 31B]